MLKLHMRCSASQMFADNNLLNFKALMRKMSNTFSNRLISSDNSITKCSWVTWLQECGDIGIANCPRVPHPSIGYFILTTLYLLYTNLFLFIFHW